MSDTVFLTGFPGFIGRRVVERLAADRPDARFYLLVEARFAFVARQACARIPGLEGRYHLLVGDIRHPQLALEPSLLERLSAEITHIWHLAAVYDLKVTRALAHAINVDGTDHVLDLAAGCANLQRLDYVSTCYVAGTRTGRVYEDELDEGQDFKNHYEATKFFAEQRARQRMGEIPTAIHRPSIVIGDSRTGETDKGDGPYVLLKFLSRLPGWLPMVCPGDGEAKQFLVPVDFLVDAMARLSAKPESLGGTFQLADPRPCTTREVLDLMLAHLGRRPSVGTVSEGLARRLLQSPRVQRALEIPFETFEYLQTKVEFDVSRTAELLGDEVTFPRLPDYFDRIASYALDHPEIFPGAAPGPPKRNRSAA